LGDLEEEFRDTRSRKPIRAYLDLYFHILTALPLFMKQTVLWSLVMLKNYLTVTWRNLTKSKVFSFINILGLSVSMAVCLLIILFIIDQKSYDRFHEQADRIYRVTTNYNSPHNNQFEDYATAPAVLAEPLQNQFPGIEKVSRIRGNFSAEIRYKNTTVPLEGLYADTTFFEIFSFELTRGNPETALRDPGSIILTNSSARKIFGEVDPMGKSVTALGNRDFTVTGIISDDYRTHFRFEALVSHSTLTGTPGYQKSLDKWRLSMSNDYLYLLLTKNTDPVELASRLASLIPIHLGDNGEEDAVDHFNLQSITAINLGPAMANEIGLVMPGIIAWFMGGFAVIITLIACFNYVSLTVARAINRSKEVGVRKVMGAFRSNVIKQFLAESVIIALIALIFASVLLKWLLPEFNNLFLIHFLDNQITIDLWKNLTVYAVFILFSIFIGISAGFYPALYLSSFKPASVLKGTSSVRGLSGQTIRKIITVSQFTFSILFIITALILTRQFNHMVNTDYGFTREQIVNVALQDVPYDRFRNAMQQLPEVERVAATSHIPALGQIHGVWMNAEGVPEKIRAHSFKVDEHYIETTGLKLIAGRNFNPDRATDSTEAVILSEVTVERLNLGKPHQAIGSTVTVDGKSHAVVGVIENFISADPLRRGNPIVLIYAPDRAYYAIVKVQENSMSDFLDDLENSWADLGSLHSLKFKLLNEQLEENPITNIFLDFLKVVGLLSIFSIFISCLGLLGLAMYSAENRMKEIGIRKVLGASITDIVLLLSRDYLWLVAIAVIIGTPLAWLANSLWLQMVSNKAEIGPLLFMIGIAGTVVLALLTIGSQTIRAAMENTVKNLRSE
ncbi:MAG: ABC transporter permease, partial [Balneolaceae bacterium]|nr:ABC transporter permease [Balneolaceae bacterium]